MVIALVVLVLTGGGVAIAVTATASGGQGISDLLAQVQTSFGDGRLLSASVNGSTLDVAIASPDEPTAISADFEAQMLADDARDSLSTSTPIDSVRYTDAHGAAVGGHGGDPVGDPTIPALANGACNAAAEAAMSKSGLSAESVLTLPYDGGSCAFTFQTSDPDFPASAPFVVGPLDGAMGAPNERAFLLEVDDQAGVPEFVYSYSSTAGGATYIKPGLSTNFVAGALQGPSSLVGEPPQPTTGQCFSGSSSNIRPVHC